MHLEKLFKEADYAALNEGPAEYSAKDETSVDLAFISIPDIIIPEGKKPVSHRKMRFRRLICAPGGVIDFHSHENRPAIVYVERGIALEHNTAFGKPRTWCAGDCWTEYNDLKHWVKNLSDTEELMLLTFDLLDDEDPVEGC